jgi:hypothetical protein
MNRRALVPVIALIGVALGGAFYLLLIDTASLPELIVLAGVALACGVTFGLGLEEGFVEAAIRPTWLAGTLRLLTAIPRDIVVVCGEAAAQLVTPRPERGAFRTVLFGATRKTPEDTGRRALTETFGSVAPNTIVVGVDPDSGRLVLHQLRPMGGEKQLDVMRLG